MTPLGFIVPLNAMLYAVRKMGPESVSFVTAVRELWAREKMAHPSRRREVAVASTAAATATSAVDGSSGAGAGSGLGRGGGGPRVRVKDGKTLID